MTPAFGFGFGDFLAIATLAWKLSASLRNAKGTSASYHNLIHELESTAQALLQAGQQLETASLPTSPANSISHGLSRCHTNLRSLDVIVQKYAKSMQTQERDRHSLFGVKTVLKKLWWEMCEKEGVDEIRSNIRNGVAEVVLILEACGLNAMGRMESKIRETCALVKRVEATIPQGLRTWYWDHKVVYLDDALGRSIPIPFELCSQWDVFHETLKLVFRGRPGSSWIEANLFNIITQNNEEVMQSRWECSVQPSTTLLMTMVVAKPRKLGENLPISCPVCNKPQPNYSFVAKSVAHASGNRSLYWYTAVGDRGKYRRFQCTKCFIWYSVSDVNYRVQFIENADNNVDNAEKPRMQLNTINADEEDIKSFKRLHLVPLTKLALSKFDGLEGRVTNPIVDGPVDELLQLLPRVRSLQRLPCFDNILAVGSCDQLILRT